AWEASRQTAKTLDREGWYLTADYSTNPPSVKLTKEPEKGSYWKLYVGKGPIESVAADKHYCLSVCETPIYRSIPNAQEDVEYRELKLSTEGSDKFEFRKFNKDDIGL